MTQQRPPSPCPSPEVLDRAFQDGADLETSRHLRQCPACALRWQQMQALRAQARQLSTPELPQERVSQVKASLLTAAASSRRAPHRAAPWLAAAAALLCAVAAWWWLSDPATPPASRATQEISQYQGAIHAQPGASFLRISAAPDEGVRLYEGRATFTVQHLEPGQRFRVITGDAEVEVRGTVFDVEAHEDRLVSVRVLQGSVEVRPEQGEAALLQPGQRWTAPPAPSAASPAAGSAVTGAVEPAAARAPTAEAAPGAQAPLGEPSASAAPRGKARSAPAQRAAEPRPASKEAPPVVISEEEEAFQRAWRALQRGEHAQAAQGFARARSLGRGKLAADASFWRGVALQRGGQPQEALRELTLFLREHPGSPRAGSASAMAGWLRLKAGDRGRARALFQAASVDPDPRVQESARAGLEALARP